MCHNRIQNVVHMLAQNLPSVKLCKNNNLYMRQNVNVYYLRSLRNPHKTMGKQSIAQSWLQAKSWFSKYQIKIYPSYRYLNTIIYMHACAVRKIESKRNCTTPTIKLFILYDETKKNWVVTGSRCWRRVDTKEHQVSSFIYIRWPNLTIQLSFWEETTLHAY